MQKLLNLLRGVFYSLYVFFAFIGGGLFFRIKQNEKPKANLILIPGILVNSLTMWPMGRFLSKRGYNVLIPNFGWNIFGVDKQAEKINLFWEKQKVDAKLPLCVIGHSMGGLIAHYWVKNYKIKTDKLITLATPFLGSKSIYWGPWYFFSASRWLEPKMEVSDFFVKDEEIQKTYFVGDDDAFVSQKSGLPEGEKGNNVLMKGRGGHSALQMSGRVFEKVLEVLER